MGNSCA